MGTPFWATTYSNKEPNNQGNEDCLHISAERSYYMSDQSGFHANSPLREENRVSVARNATAPTSCPRPYLELAGLCLAFITWADQVWAEARQTCHGLSGELAALTGIEQLRAVYLYLHQESITYDSFWLGGSDIENSFLEALVGHYFFDGHCEMSLNPLCMRKQQ
ncbi:uncharacterized protein LOC125037454 [Penaeus chinensis]|uniref:uncharacterized protein LOC125037454 n=1 Tax=Penaeus chinensis TaxID=139456 RepID=UPI001FB5C59F|nr:uncharacterized protein LOC125037454 [Penaeus chinensis]